MIGVDLGRARDYSAWVVARRSDDENAARYDVVHIDRVRGALYPAVVEHTRSVVDPQREEQPRPHVDLVIDYMGIGSAMVNLLMDAAFATSSTMLVTITGGDATERGERDESRVPKRDLAAVVQLLL